MNAKKANATMHKGAGNPVSGMVSAKVATKPSFNAGAKEGQNVPFVTKQNGMKGNSKKVDRYQDPVVTEDVTV